MPKDRRKILTSHDAFGYFGREYGVNFCRLSALDRNRGFRRRRCQADRPDQKEKVKTYFFENSNDARLVQQISKATGAEPGGELYVEALSKEDGPAPTYAKDVPLQRRSNFKGHSPEPDRRPMT